MKNKIDNILGGTLAIFLAIMVINVIWQVFSRYILGSPSTFTDEFSTFLLIWVGLLGAAFATGRGSHLAIDILPNQLTGKKQKRLKILITAMIILFALCVMVIGGSRLVYLTLLLKQLSPSLQIPLGIVYSVIPLSGVLIIYYAIDQLMEQRDGGY